MDITDIRRKYGGHCEQFKTKSLDKISADIYSHPMALRGSADYDDAFTHSDADDAAPGELTEDFQLEGHTPEESRRYREGYNTRRQAYVQNQQG